MTFGGVLGNSITGSQAALVLVTVPPVSVFFAPLLLVPSSKVQLRTVQCSSKAATSPMDKKQASLLMM